VHDLGGPASGSNGTTCCRSGTSIAAPEPNSTAAIQTAIGSSYACPTSRAQREILIAWLQPQLASRVFDGARGRSWEPGHRHGRWHAVQGDRFHQRIAQCAGGLRIFRSNQMNDAEANSRRAFESCCWQRLGRVELCSGTTRKRIAWRLAEELSAKNGRPSTLPGSLEFHGSLQSLWKTRCEPIQNPPPYGLEQRRQVRGNLLARRLAAVALDANSGG